MHNDNEQLLTGDVFEAPISHGMQVQGGAPPPSYGDILDITPEALSVGDIVALSELGDVFETGALQVPSKAVTFSDNRGQALGRPAPNPRTVNAQVALGRNMAKQQLMAAGISRPGVQQTVIQTAEEVARMNRLGQRALGILGPNDYVPFSYAEKGRLHTLENIREGAGAKASSVKIMLQQQLFQPLLPFRRVSASAIPAPGGTVNLTASLPSSTDQYGFLFFVVRLSSTMLNSNPSKLLTLTLSEGVGAVVTRTYQRHLVSYDTDGVCELIIMPGYEVQGNYWPRVLIGQNDPVPANVRDINFTLTGNDGTSDNITIFGIGPDDWYWNKMMNRFSA